MAGVDQFVRTRRDIRENAQPTERIDPFECPDGIGRNTGARHAAKAIAACDEIGCERLCHAILDEGTLGFTPAKSCNVTASALNTVDNPDASPRIHQIARDLGLAIDGDMFAGEGLQIDADAPVRVADGEPLVREPLRRQTISDPGQAEQVHGSLLEHARPDPGQDMRAGSMFENDVIDARASEQCTEHQPDGPEPMMATCVRMNDLPWALVRTQPASRAPTA